MQVRYNKRKWKSYSQMSPGDAFLWNGKPCLKCTCDDGSGHFVLMLEGIPVSLTDSPHGNEEFPVDESPQFIIDFPARRVPVQSPVDNSPAT